MHIINLWQSLILLTILLLSGCTASPVADIGMSQQQAAMDTGLKIASMSRPEMSGSQVAPTNVQAEQMTLAKAIKRVRENGDVATGYTPDTLVWLVTMDGVWLDEFPRPAGSLTPQPYRHILIIIDAKTGLEIESSAHP
jgi:hypothetical protein